MFISKSFSLFILLLLVLPIYEVEAHGGRTNSEGCHNDRKRGGYHCHNSGYKKVKKSKKVKKKSYSKSSYSSKKHVRTTPQIQNFSSVSQVNLIRETQRLLKRLGYSIGKVDGVFGNKTAKAIRSFQLKNKLKMTGLPSKSLLEKIRIKALTT